MCDGYYFPISFSTMRSEFARDADKCAASCGSEARLFYHPNPGGDVEGMTDLTGMAYTALPNAFKYRKTLVDDCSCKPQPWSEAEQERHRSYAASPRPRTDDSGSRTAASETRAHPAARYGLPSAPRGNGNVQGVPFPPRRGPPGGVFR
jgi:hypothetical protein